MQRELLYNSSIQRERISTLLYVLDIYFLSWFSLIQCISFYLWFSCCFPFRQCTLWYSSNQSVVSVVWLYVVEPAVSSQFDHDTWCRKFTGNFILFIRFQTFLPWWICNFFSEMSKDNTQVLICGWVGYVPSKT